VTNFWFSPRLYPAGASDAELSLPASVLASVEALSVPPADASGFASGFASVEAVSLAPADASGFASVFAAVTVISVIVRSISGVRCVNRADIGQDVRRIKPPGPGDQDAARIFDLIDESLAIYRLVSGYLGAQVAGADDRWEKFAKFRINVETKNAGFT
jgi:hypothetical protein